MQGFKPKAAKAAKPGAAAGLIKGPGTGTSDSIQTTVPSGTFIMPADSVAQIGADRLQAGARGFTPVNVSDGEVAIPPEQVQAIGAATLEKMRAATHMPTGQPQVQPGQAGEPELFFADGGLVDDEARRRIYVAPDGAANRGAMPSTSREMVPAGERVQHSTSRAMVPASQPVGATSTPSPAQPAALPAPRAERVQAEPDYRARATAMHRARADTAAWEAERAAQEARFDNAQRSTPRQSLGARVRGVIPSRLRGMGALGTAASAIPEAADVYDVATADNTDGLDVATQVAEGSGRMAAAGAGAALGAKGGAALGLAGGPFAAFTVPAGAAIGGITGGAAGFFGSDWLIRKGRELAGGDPQSPVDRVNAAQQPTVAQQQPVPAELSATTAPAADAPVQERATQPAANLPNNVTRVGNSYSGTRVGLGFTVNGQPFEETGISASEGDPVRSAQNDAAVQALFARTPELGEGGAARVARGGFQPTSSRGGVIRDSGAADAERRRLIRAASTPYRGAQNGQLTANQLNTLRAIYDGDQRTDSARELAQVNAGTQLATTQMTQAGADRRAAASNALDAERITSDRESRGFQNRAAQRMERLYEQYEQAAPEQRSAIAQQIRELSGRDAPNRFTVVPGGQVIDPTTQQLVTQPSLVLNNQTGEFVQRQPQGGQQVPQVGEVRGGYRFRGGDPSAQSNWEKI